MLHVQSRSARGSPLLTVLVSMGSRSALAAAGGRLEGSAWLSRRSPHALVRLSAGRAGIGITVPGSSAFCQHTPACQHFGAASSRCRQAQRPRPPPGPSEFSELDRTLRTRSRNRSLWNPRRGCSFHAVRCFWSCPLQVGSAGSDQACVQFPGFRHRSYRTDCGACFL